MKSATSSRLVGAILILVLLGACAGTHEEDAAAKLAEAPTETPQLHAPTQAEAAGAEKPHLIPAPAAPAAQDRRVEPALKMAREAMALTATAVQAPLARNRERYGQINENPIRQVAEAPVSTFSIDVDTGSFSNVRRILNGGRLPPADAVRVEEMINYFPYDYAQPRDGRPFAVHSELAIAPWNAERVLLRVGIKGFDAAKASLPPANLVFLVDVSGSMDSADKLPLLKSSLKLLVKEMREQDRISLVTYASGTRVALQPTSGADKASLYAAIDALKAGGGTAGASGIELAYNAAQRGFIKGGINRILLATDGDFNLGISDTRQTQESGGGETQERHIALDAGFRHRQSERRNDGADRRRGRRQLLVHRQSDGKPQGVGQRNELHAGYHRARRESADRVQSRRGEGVSPDRLRQPSARARGFQQRQGRCRRHRRRPHRDRAL